MPALCLSRAIHCRVNEKKTKNSSFMLYSDTIWNEKIARDPLENASTLYGTRDDAQYWTNVVTYRKTSLVYIHEYGIELIYAYMLGRQFKQCVFESDRDRSCCSHSLAQLSTLNGHSIQYTEKHTDIQLRRQLHKVFWSDDLANERFGSHLFLSLSPYVYIHISVYIYLSIYLSIYFSSISLTPVFHFNFIFLVCKWNPVANWTFRCKLYFASTFKWIRGGGSCGIFTIRRHWSSVHT